ISTVAPICGMPLLLRTKPEMEPGRSAARPSRALAASISTSARNPSFRTITPPPPGRASARLLYGERRRRIDRLLGDVVVYLNLDFIYAGSQIDCCQALLQRQLVPDIPHLLSGFHRMHHRLVR